MRQHGMTLVELMVSLTIIGIVVGLGVPAFRDYLNNSKIRAAGDSITAGLNRARMEAIMRNTPVVFTPNATGWQIVITATGQVVAQSESAQFGSNLATAPSAASISFNGRGRTTSVANFTLGISSPVSGACAAVGGTIRCLQVEVSTSGQVKLCDPALPATDPRAC